MRHKIHRHLLRLAITLAGLFALPGPAAAEDTLAAEGLDISLLTCSPGPRSYELYGHTALRVVDRATGSDWTFNFGIFDFSKPHFTWRFALGETDYTVGVVPTPFFLSSYAREGRSVEAQALRLTQAEAARIVATLDSLVAIEGWTYRYNFLTDNCTTRAVDLVRRSLDGRLEWSAEATPTTYRRIIHEYAAESAPWTTFSQDLALGAAADTLIGRREQMFAPLYAARYLDSARVVRADGRATPLVSGHTTLARPDGPAPEDKTPVAPTVIAMLLLVLSLIVSAREWKARRMSRTLDGLLLLVQGLAGCLIGLLFFLSEHPTVGSNWLILLLNPLALAAFPLMWWRGRDASATLLRGHRVVLCLWGIEASAVIAAGALGLQSYPPALWVLLLLLLLRAASGLLLDRHQRTAHA